MNATDVYAEKQSQGIDQQFIEEIKSVRQMITALRSNNYQIQTIKAKYAKAIKSAQQQANSQQMTDILQHNSQLQASIKQKLKSLENRVKEAQHKEKDEPQTRMKRNFYNGLHKQIREVLQKQQKNQSSYKATVKQKIVRQVRLVDRNIEDEQLQEYVQNPNLAQQMLQRKIYGEGSITLKNTVSDIQDKFRDIQKLEISVKQCVELMNQLTTLVNAQGQKIDSIEHNVADCKNYVEKAQVKLTQAKQHHKCSKKCMCIAIIVGLIILIVIVIVIVTTTK